MNEQVADLLARYTSALSTSGANDKSLVDGYNTLRLADAQLDKLKLNESHPDHPLQIVVIGPTQAGKSTLCNLILDNNSAGISALAGYTVHAHGFAANVDEEQLEPLATLMLPLERIASAQMSNEEFNHYSLEKIQPGDSTMLQQGVVWDSPDFDSIESAGYKGSVIQVIGLADVLILMVSKDKYADKTVWDTLAMVRRLGKPMFVCINKLDQQDENTVLSSFSKRHDEQFGCAPPPIVALPFVKQNSTANGNTELAVDIGSAAHAKLHTELATTMSSVSRQEQHGHIESFVQHHWPEWMAPIDLELSAREQWRTAVDDAIKDAKERYTTRYLNNPKKYDSFNKAIAELLTLLEIPGMAKALTTTRTIVTWPARKLFGIGKSLTKRETQPTDQEMEVLELILEQTLTHLQGYIMVEQQEGDSNHAFWPVLNSAMHEEKSHIRERYKQRVSALQEEFEPRIDATAEQLYRQLQEQPALLNTLRAARVSTDAAAVVLAVKSGGLAAADLVIAPAMLSVTTLLTESVLGQYMERTKKQLVGEQKDLMEEQLFERELQDRLNALAEQLDHHQLLASGLTERPRF